MKSPITTKIVATNTPEQQLASVLNENPELAAAVEALRITVDRFQLIRGKLHDLSVEAVAKKREADTRHEVVRAQALKEIGDYSAHQLEAARKDHEAAKAALEQVSGRDQILADELRKVQADLQVAHDALADAVTPWRGNVVDAAKTLAAEGARLIQVAALAMHAAGSRNSLPIHRDDISDWLEAQNIVLPIDLVRREDDKFSPITKHTPTVAPLAASALDLLDRSNGMKDEEIRIPTAPTYLPAEAAADSSDRVEPEYNTFGRPILEKLTEAERTKFATQPEVVPAGVSVFSRPGVPAGLTHDPLGNPLPEAKGLLDRLKLRRGSPYTDGRDGVKEVAR